MKVILTGATGFIGHEVLLQALEHKDITTLVCLTRKPLPETVTSNPKLKAIIHEDFSTYPDEVLGQLHGAQACIWALGSPARKNTDMDYCRSVEVGFTRAAASAFAQYLAPQVPKGKSFRFLYLSGMFAERNPDTKVWFLEDSRRIKGEVENSLIAIKKDENNSNFDVAIVRPGGVLARGNLTPSIVAAKLLLIHIEELAAAMIAITLDDESIVQSFLTRNESRLFENDVLRYRGKQALAEKA
ncbi:hypothetical protein B0O99DRAFT_619422 [Bisporella sp. PMI_857]|nr:hypothetical protein B0O99DRAFT_619422 [Bisporella sp. PMI_857]